jgi:D-glycero-alpha-D-manno-heptose 1-phosphate guanylyltransferase
MTFEAIVLAGGFGTRLRHVVPDLPKALAPVAGRPFIDFLLESLAAAACKRVVMAVGYRRELIIEHLGSRFAGIEIAYSVENEPLGTGGATRDALAQLRSSEAIVLNGDTWMDLDFAAMIAAHRSVDARVTIAVREVADVARFGAVEVDQGRVTAFADKGRSGAGLINAGAYVLERDLFEQDQLPRAFSLETDFIGPNLGHLSPLAFRTEGTFIDIGVPDDYARARALLSLRPTP